MFSILIITKNAEYNLEDVLKKSCLISNDIVVVDSGSTDNTKNICDKYQVKFIYNKWEGYGNQKNYGATLCKYDYILSLDADEVIDDNLSDSLKNINIDNYDAYYVFRKNYYWNNYIRVKIFHEEKFIRLYNKYKVRWDDNKLHEKLIFDDHIKTKLLSGNLLHFTSKSYDELKNKTLHYSNLYAIKNKNKKVYFYKPYVASLWNFVYLYFLCFNFLKGKTGLLVSWQYAKYAYMKYKNILINEY